MIEDIQKAKKNEVPFAGKLKRSDVSEAHKKFPGKLNELENNPNKVIRIQRFDELRGSYDEIIERVQTANKLYRELETKYGILVPADFFIGKDKKGKEVVYSVVDKIQGENLINVERSDEVIAQADVLYASIAKYLFDKKKEGGLYLSDIDGPSQYVYGRKMNGQENKIYLVDTDICTSDSRTLYLAVNRLIRSISMIEKRFQTRLEKAREYIGQFANQPLPEATAYSEVREYVNEIKKFLDDGELDSNS